jgi:hypothetical protein
MGAFLTEFGIGGIFRLALGAFCQHDFSLDYIDKEYP